MDSFKFVRGDFLFFKYRLSSRRKVKAYVCICVKSKQCLMGINFPFECTLLQPYYVIGGIIFRQSSVLIYNQKTISFLGWKTSRNIFFLFPGFIKKRHNWRGWWSVCDLCKLLPHLPEPSKDKSLLKIAELLPGHLSQSWRWVIRFKPQEVKTQKERKWVHDLYLHPHPPQGRKKPNTWMNWKPWVGTGKTNFRPTSTKVRNENTLSSLSFLTQVRLSQGSGEP